MNVLGLNESQQINVYGFLTGANFAGTISQPWNVIEDTNERKHLMKVFSKNESSFSIEMIRVHDSIFYNRYHLAVTIKTISIYSYIPSASSEKVLYQVIPRVMSFLVSLRKILFNVTWKVALNINQKIVRGPSIVTSTINTRTTKQLNWLLTIPVSKPETWIY